MRRQALAALLAVSAAAVGPGPAAGTDDVATTTTTSTTEPAAGATTTLPPPTVPGPKGGDAAAAVPPSVPLPEAVPGGGDEAVEEEALPEEAPPASALPAPGSLPAPGTEPVPNLEQARLGLMVALGLEAQGRAAVADAEAGLAERTSALAAMDRRERRAVEALDRQRARVRRWAIHAYTGGSLRRVAYVLESKDLNDLPRRLGLASGAFGGLDEHVREQEAALGAVAARHRAAARARDAAGQHLLDTRLAADEATAQVAARRAELAALDAGQDVSIGGVAFPVAGAAWFGDTFGASRMAGTRYAHPHQGVDIFATSGTPVVAFERGVVVRVGTDVLGGTKLWLVGETGARYYYAHLSAYAPGLVEGLAVEVGQTLAYVGNTGNAVRTSPHLHFEIHPGDGPATNPYPVLARITDAARIGASLLQEAVQDGAGNPLH